jgi:hypothetical protein
MIETLDDLYQSGALSKAELSESMRNMENRTKELKGASATSPKQEKS